MDMTPQFINAMLYCSLALAMAIVCAILIIRSVDASVDIVAGVFLRLWTLCTGYQRDTSKDLATRAYATLTALLDHQIAIMRYSDTCSLRFGICTTTPEATLYVALVRDVKGITNIQVYQAADATEALAVLCSVFGDSFVHDSEDVDVITRMRRQLHRRTVICDIVQQMAIVRSLDHASMVPADTLYMRGEAHEGMCGMTFTRSSIMSYPNAVSIADLPDLPLVS